MRARMMLVIVVAVAVVTAACGDSKSSLLPTAPSGLAAAPNVDASTTASGTMGNKPKPGNGNGRLPGATTETATKVEFEGAIDDVNADGSIKVDGQWVAIVAGQTVIRKGDRDVPQSELKKGDRVHVTANKIGTVVVATEIKLQNPCNSCPVEPPAADPQVVSVTAPDALAVEGGTNNGTFRVVRTGTTEQLLAPLSVSFTLEGTTALSTEYSLSPSVLNFTGGVATIDVTVTAVTDTVSDSDSVVLSLTAGSSGYVVSASSASATVTINDPPPAAPVVDIALIDDMASEVENSGRFDLTRDRNLSQELTVTVEFSGTATFGSDYIVTAQTGAGVPIPVAISGQRVTFTFPAGQEMVRVFVSPSWDEADDMGEEIIMTVLDGADYDLGPTRSGSVFIDLF